MWASNSCSCWVASNFVQVKTIANWYAEVKIIESNRHKFDILNWWNEKKKKNWEEFTTFKFFVEEEDIDRIEPNTSPTLQLLACTKVTKQTVDEVSLEAAVFSPCVSCQSLCRAKSFKIDGRHQVPFETSSTKPFFNWIVSSPIIFFFCKSSNLSLLFCLSLEFKKTVLKWFSMTKDTKWNWRGKN